MTELKDKVILITGAAGGMGQELTLALLNEEAHLILTDLNYKALDLFVRSTLHDKGEILGFFAADISTEQGCQEVFERTSQISGHIDLLINNAGMATVGKFADIPDEKWEKVLAVNMLAPMRLTKKFLPKMAERKSGHIVNMVSITGMVGAGELVPYSTSKFALSGFGEALYNEVRDLGIKVSNIYPTFTRTKLIHSEQFGYNSRKQLPDLLIGEPRHVIRNLLKGIKKEKLYVYPGASAKALNLLKRLNPYLINFLVRVLRNKTEKKLKA